MKNISTVGQLIKEGKLDEARAVMQEAISAPLTDIERGRALAMLAMAYLESRNTIDKDFLADMKKTIQSIQQVNKQIREVDDSIKLAKVRQSLK